MRNGYLVISLDFELMWGVRDSQTKKSYGQNILGSKSAINEMLISFDKFDINVTFAIVGFLFHQSKGDILNNQPIILPGYKNKNLSPYQSIEKEVGNNEQDDPFHFGFSVINQIKNYPKHEIASHTYSHFYCMEKGQTITEFEEDIKKAIEVASKCGVYFKSIIFPRNQSNIEYLEVCKKYGIEIFRGNENHFIYSSKSNRKENNLIRILRFLDSYFNITGFHCYDTEEMRNTIPINIPSSRFLRPFSPKLYFLEKLKLIRIKNAMTYAAKNNLVYHLWWHPHNFGINLEQNINLLNNILSHYKYLSNKFNFESITMQKLAEKIK